MYKKVAIELFFKRDLIDFLVELLKMPCSLGVEIDMALCFVLGTRINIWCFGRQGHEDSDLFFWVVVGAFR